MNTAQAITPEQHAAQLNASQYKFNVKSLRLRKIKRNNTHKFTREQGLEIMEMLRK